jgi:hypothetical protein
VTARSTKDQLKALMAPYADNSPDATLDLFINQAAMLVDEDLVGKGLSSDRLLYIEMNLAAHFATISIERGGFTQQVAGQSSESYSMARDRVKLSSTRFGQQAIAMDSTSSLQNMDSQAGRAEFRVL